MEDLVRKFRAAVEGEAWHYSRLGRYMREHPEKIEEVLAVAKGDWSWIARALAMLKLTDHLGSGPTAETAHETWQRVRARRQQDTKTGPPRNDRTGRTLDLGPEEAPMPAKRELIDTGTDKRYVRRDAAGKFKESDDVGRSLAADRRRTAKTPAKPGQGDKGDRPKKP